MTRTSAPLAGVLPLAFASGACALVYQVAWTRDLRLVFGASTPASAAVVAIFAGGLGLGAWRLGARAERSARPLRLYAGLELGVAASSFASPLLVQLAMRVYTALGGSVVLGTAGATLVRLLLATMVLAVPTLLMGGTLPALARACTAHEGDPSRRGVALLYGINTLGAVLGCAGANFLLLEKLGTTATLWLATAVNALVALAAWRMARRLSPLSIEDSDPVACAPVGVDEAPEAPAPAPAPTAFVLAAAAVVGFAFFLMELVFYRMLIPLLGGTIYTFGLVLAVALLGIGLGGGAYAVLFARRPARLSSFASTCLLEAAGLAVPYALGDRIALLTLHVRPHAEASFGRHVAGWLLIAAIVVLPASLAAGVQFPMLIALLGRGRRQVARQVGLAYAWNTFGAIAGALAGGFGLMTALTAPGCWRFAAALLVVTGIAALVLAWPVERRWLHTGAQVAVALTTAFLLRVALGPTAAWRITGIGAGRASDPTSPLVTTSFVRDARRELVWEQDGLESHVAISARSGYAFLNNGKSDGHCGYDAGTQVMGGLLGAMLVPSPRSAMVIGLGSGSTAGWLGRVPTMDRVDVVEIEPAMLEVARRCAPVNEDVLENPRVHVVRGDAREVLSVTRDRYDVVFSEPSNPYRAGVASLYTREYYDRIREHLAPGGVFLQWVQAYDVDESTMRTIFATLAASFPYVEAWQAEYADLVLVASREPLAKNVSALRGRIASEPFARALHLAWAVDDLEGVLAHFVDRASFVRELAASHGGPLNTDDRNVVEFGFARGLDLPGAQRVSVPTIRGWAAEAGALDPEVLGGDVDWERVHLNRAEIPRASARPPYDAPDGATEDTRERVEFERLVDDFAWAKALAVWDRRPREPLTLVEAFDLAQVGVQRDDPRAPQWIANIASSRPLDALALQAELLVDHKRDGDAAEVLERAFTRYRTDPWASYMLMGLALLQTRFIAGREPALAPRLRDLLSQPFAIEWLRDERLQRLVDIGSQHGSLTDCVALLRPLEPNTPWRGWDLQYRRDCYRANGDPRAALAERELQEQSRQEQLFIQTSAP